MCWLFILYCEMKAAKADPYNPDVILYIGHYQRQVAGDVRYIQVACGYTQKLRQCSLTYSMYKVAYVSFVFCYCLYHVHGTSSSISKSP